MHVSKTKNNLKENELKSRAQSPQDELSNSALQRLREASKASELAEGKKTAQVSWTSPVPSKKKAPTVYIGPSLFLMENEPAQDVAKQNVQDMENVETTPVAPVVPVEAETDEAHLPEVDLMKSMVDKHKENIQRAARGELPKTPAKAPATPKNQSKKAASTKRQAVSSVKSTSVTSKNDNRNSSSSSIVYKKSIDAVPVSLDEMFADAVNDMDTTAFVPVVAADTAQPKVVPVDADAEIAAGEFRLYPSKHTKAQETYVTYAEEYHAEDRNVKKFVILTVVAVLIIVAALGAFFLLNEHKASVEKTLAWEQVATYAVPDGLLQDGQPEHADTLVTYVFDIPSDGEPYVNEQHAMLSYELFDRAKKEDLAEETQDGKSFPEVIEPYGNVKNAYGETNGKTVKLEVHLPEEARETVEALSAQQ